MIKIIMKHEFYYILNQEKMREQLSKRKFFDDADVYEKNRVFSTISPTPAAATFWLQSFRNLLFL